MATFVSENLIHIYIARLDFGVRLTREAFYSGPGLDNRLSSRKVGKLRKLQHRRWKIEIRRQSYGNQIYRAVSFTRLKYTVAQTEAL